MNRFMPPALQRRSIGDDYERRRQRAVERANLTATPASSLADDTAAKRIRRMVAEVRRYEVMTARIRAERGLFDDYGPLKMVAADLGINPETLRVWAVEGEVDARHPDIESSLWEISRSSAAARQARMTTSS